MNKRKSSYVDIVDLGKTPPQAIELEGNVLGCIMLYPDSYIRVSHLLSPETFYKEEHQYIYQSIVNVYTEKDTCDKLMVINDLDKRGLIKAIGGVFYITELTSSVVSDTNIEFWSRTILDKFILRENIRMSMQQVQQSFEVDADANHVIQATARNSDKLASIWVNKLSGLSDQDNVSECISDLKKRCENFNSGILNGIPSGLTDLDRLLNGFQKSDLIVIAGRPAMGKTSCALSFAYHCSKAGYPAKFFSLEMSKRQLMYKLILSESGVNPEAIRSGDVCERDWTKINIAADIIRHVPIYIDDSPGVTPEYIYATTKLDVSKGKCSIVFIDYLDLIDYHMPGNSKDNDIGEITKRMKALAKSAEIPVVLLCQLSREVERRGGVKRPQLQDLRNSGNIEQDSDVVMFIYRPEYYKLETDKEQVIRGRGAILVQKNRQGPTDDIKFSYNPWMTRIGDDTGINKYLGEEEPF